MKHLMEEVFQVLYDRDSEMLGTIIKEYGYFDETPQKKEYDFEEFMEFIEKIAKEQEIEAEDIAIRIANTLKISDEARNEIFLSLFKGTTDDENEEFISNIVEATQQKKEIVRMNLVCRILQETPNMFEEASLAESLIEDLFENAEFDTAIRILKNVRKKFKAKKKEFKEGKVELEEKGSE